MALTPQEKETAKDFGRRTGRGVDVSAAFNSAKRNIETRSATDAREFDRIYQTTLRKSAPKTGRPAKAVNAAAGAGAMFAGMPTSVSEAFVKVLQQLPGNIGNVILSLEKMDVSLAKTTSAFTGAERGAHKLSKEIFALQAANAELGFTNEMLRKNFGMLVHQFDGAITPAFKTNRLALTETMTGYERLGVTGYEYNSFLNTNMAALGRSRQETIKTARVLNKFAEDTMLPANVVWQMYNKNVDLFIHQLGSPEMTRQTLLFASRAKRMNMEVGTLVRGLETFDEIEAGARVGAQMNVALSVMGSGFDAVKASMMDLPARFDYIVNQFKKAQPFLDTLDTQQRRIAMKAMARGTPFTRPGDIARLLKIRPETMTDAEKRLMMGGQLRAQTAGEERESLRTVTTIQDRAAAFRERAVFGVAQTAARAMRLPTAGAGLAPAGRAMGLTDEKIMSVIGKHADILADRTANVLGNHLAQVYNGSQLNTVVNRLKTELGDIADELTRERIRRIGG